MVTKTEEGREVVWGKGKEQVENGEVEDILVIGDGGSEKQALLQATKSDDSLGACRKVYVGGIPYYSSEDDIRSYFEGCGTITEFDCMTFPESGKFRGIAIIISFKTEAASKRALALDGTDMEVLNLFGSDTTSCSRTFDLLAGEDYS